MSKRKRLNAGLMLLTLLVSQLIFSSCTPGTKNEKALPLLIELVDATEQELSTLSSLPELATLTTYTWKNHVVYYGSSAGGESVLGLVESHLDTGKAKLYHDLAYRYDYAMHCGQGYLSQDWKHYLLTANLVEDAAMQREYLDYHERQFEEWPEVANGFCNASFQELLVYTHGRQLMLVISVPGDQTLESLNPKTTENNPRMEEWNGLMAKYQEGIPGTAPDETWVFLSPQD